MKKTTQQIITQDAMIILRSYEDYEPGAFVDTLYNKKEGAVELAARDKSESNKGQYITPALSTGFPIKEIIPSWNVYCPKNCGYIVELRVSSDKEKWSPWFYLGRWGKAPREKKRISKNAWGKVCIDYFVSQAGVASVQGRFRFFSHSKDETPRLTLFALALSDYRGDKNLPLRTRPAEKSPVELWNKQLEVPYRSQGTEDSSIAGEICSPTSVSMVMEYWGINRPTAEVARLIYEPEHKLYGIWWRGVQGAAQYGLQGWVQYFRNWEEVKQWISAGQPVIACICFDADTLSGSMTPESDGHVIVIIGFDKHGNPVCNDPAGSSSEDGVITYNRDEFAAAWFDKGGVGYIIAPIDRYTE